VAELEALIAEVDLARHEQDLISERLDDLHANTVQTKNGQKVY